MKEYSPQLPYILDWADVYLTPLYMYFIYRIVKWWKNKYYTGSPLAKYIYPAIFLRMIGAVILALVYNFIYKYGDTFGYYTAANEIWNAFLENPSIAWELITQPSAEWSEQALKLAPHMSWVEHADSQHAIFRTSGVLGFFSFGTYLPIAMFYSLLSFWGSWMILLVFYKRFPHLHRFIAFGTLFIPSFIIWSNGLLKEPLCVFSIGLCFYSFNSFLEGRHLIRNVLMFLFGAYILLTIKYYILLAFIVGAFFWLYKHFLDKIRTVFFRRAVKITFWVFLTLIIITLSEMGTIGVYLSGMLDRAETLQNAMTRINEQFGGSSYSMPTGDFSPGGIVWGFIAGVNVALFRPYAWEITNVLMIFNFMESFITTLLVIWLLYRFMRGKILYRSNGWDILLFSFIFSMTMAFMAGFTSFNFGTLIRYKVPFIPFFYPMIFILIFNEKRISNLKE